MANEQIQRYRIGRIAVGKAGQQAVALLPDPDGDAVKFSDHLAAITDLREGQMHLAMELERKDEQIRKLREALTDLLEATPLEECGADCNDENCPWKRARAALKAGE